MLIRKQLTKYLLKCNQIQKNAEKIRQGIAQNHYFQTESVFQRLDKFRKGYLIPSDLAEFLLQNKLYPQQAELFIIFKDFDLQKVGVITLDRFQEEIIPRDNQNLRKEALRRKPYPADIRLSIDLQFMLTRYFESKLLAIKQLNKLRIQMKIDKHYSTQEAFGLIDFRKQGYIASIQQIDHFLRQNGQAVTHEDLNRIYRYLNFNKKMQITFETFFEHLQPLTKGYYQFYTQRLLEKSKLNNLLIEKQFHVQKDLIEKATLNAYLSEDIHHLRQSNRRLEDILHEQDIELLKSSKYINDMKRFY